MTWWNRLRRREQIEQDLDRELRFHIEQYADDLVANGRTREEARREVRLAMGGPEQLKEECRDARGTRWIEDLWQDVRYAGRTMRQKPAFTAVALLTLALGTGATTVMFTVIDSVLLKPLAYPHADRLLQIMSRTEKFGETWSIAYPDFLDMPRSLGKLAEVAAWSYNGGGTVTSPGEPAWLLGREISSNLFAVLGTPMERGRAFLPDEDRRGGAEVIIISHALWLSRFGGSETAIGQSVVLDGKRRTVVGVAPAAFQPGGETDLFTPLGQDTAPRMNNRAASFLPVIARLRDGVTIAQAQSALKALGHNLAMTYPTSNTDRSFLAQSMQQETVRNVRSTLWILLGAVGLVLLIACVNVASLLLARAVSRERELALRVALGARSARLMRQCLTESALLGICSGALGTLIAVFGIRPFVTAWPEGLPRAEEIRLDWHVLAFALAVSLLCGVLFGLAPALRAPKKRLEQALRASGRSMAGSAHRLHGAFVGLQIALAVVLLVSAGLLGRAMLRLSSVDLGLNPHNILTARAAISPSVLADPARTRTAWMDFLERTQNTAGVEHAALTDIIPMRAGENTLDYWTSPDMPPVNRRYASLATSATPDLLAVMGIPLRRGRFFDQQDRLGSEPVIVIDDSLAQRAFGSADPIGKQLWVPSLANGPVRVIGEVAHVQNWGPAGNAEIRDELYYPFAQVPDGLMRLFSGFMSIAVRTRVPPLDEIAPLQRGVRGAGGDQVIYMFSSMEQLARASIARQRFLMVLFGVFAGVALLLASVGIYGVLAYLTSQRVPEIGVRMALGARSASVMRMVLGQSFTMVSAGVVLGVFAAMAAGRLLQRLIAGVEGWDPLTVLLMIAVLAAAALAASLAPARRASLVDPMTALRQE